MFPRFLSTLHARSDQAQVHQALLENLWDEEHGADALEAWWGFLDGVDPDVSG